MKPHRFPDEPREQKDGRSDKRIRRFRCSLVAFDLTRRQQFAAAG
jgi:hypothetical protein